MTKADINFFLQAKKHQKKPWFAFVAGLCGLAIGAGIAATNGGVVGSFLFCGIGFIFGFLAAVVGPWSVSPGRLIEIIEAQIGRDPEALRYIAALRGPAEQTAQTDRA